MNWYTDTPGWMGTWMWVPALLIVVLLVVVMTTLLRANSRSGPAGVSALDTPLAIAGRRLAMGEITSDEYEKVRATLSKS